MANLKKALDFNFRNGKVIDIVDMLDDIESMYRSSLKESIEVYTTQDEVTDETYNDELQCKMAVSMLHRLGYIDDEEHNKMIEKIKEIRLNALCEMEKEIENLKKEGK